MRYTEIINTKGILAKRIKSDGTKESNAHLSEGKYKTIEVKSLEEFDNKLNKLKSNQAIVLGTTDEDEGYIATKYNISETQKKYPEHSVITRSKDNFSFEDETIVLFDIDVDGGENIQCNSYEDVREIMIKLDSQFENAEMLIRHSSSSHIYKWNKGDKELIQGSGSYHIYVVVKSSNHLSRYIENLENRAWMLDYGYIKITTAGSLLKRQVFDSAVFSPERLIFEANIVCEEPYEQEKPKSFYKQGSVIDCTIDLNINTEEVRSKIKIAKNESSEEAGKIKDKFIGKKVTQFISAGYNEVEAKRCANQIFTDKKLFPENEIVLSDYTSITANDIFLYPEKYNNKKCCDPIETTKGVKAIIYSNNGINPIIHSFVYGGSTYELVANYATLQSIVNEYISYEHTKIENINFVAKIKSMIYNIKLDSAKVTELARLLKSEKVISSINDLAITASEKKEMAEEEGYVDFCPKGNIISSPDNLKVLMNNNTINFKYDVIFKDYDITHHSIKKDAPMKEASVNSLIETVAAVNGINTGIVSHISALANKDYSNPLLDAVKEYHQTYKTQNNNVDYIQKVADTLTTTASDKYKKAIITKWLIQCVAAWDYERTSKAQGHKNKYESVLIFQGEQGLRKSDFFSGLLPKAQSEYIKDGANLNLQDKDSIIQNTAYGIVELGEIERTLSKSSSGDLKAFLSSSYDEYRVPYGKASDKHKRTTSFCASVNLSDFLTDPTGARRFWILALEEIAFKEYESIDKKMLWGQIYDLYQSGASWWFDDKDVDILKELKKLHSIHNEISIANEIFEIVETNNSNQQWQSVSDIFTKCLAAKGITKSITKKDTNDLAALLDANGYKRNSSKQFCVYLSNSKLSINSNGSTATNPMSIKAAHKQRIK